MEDRMEQTRPGDRTPLNIDLRELNVLREVTSHKEIALARALDYCATHEIDPPQWLVAAAAALMIELLKSQKTKRRGRTASLLASFRYELWDIERWDAVYEARRVRAMAEQDDEALKARPNIFVSEAVKKRREKRRIWLKQGTFECASELLRGRDAFASPHSVRASYRKIEENKNDPSRVLGAWFDDPFKEKLGLQGNLDRKGGKNTLYFY
jgi:hypothetical protein